MKYVVKRNGERQQFDPIKIKSAIIKATTEDGKFDDEYAEQLSDFVMNDVVAIIGDNKALTVEEIQDVVEEVLMEYNKQIAKSYIIYRNDHAQKRKNKSVAEFNTLANNKFSFQHYVNVLLTDYADLRDHIFETGVKVWSSSIDKTDTKQMLNLLIIELRSQIQYEPKYSNVCADILNDVIFLENFNTVYKETPTEKDATSTMPLELFLLLDSLEYGQRVNRISRNVVDAYTDHDLYTIGLHAINSIKRGDKTLIGVQTLYDRYLLHDNDNRYESIHGMFVRVALGLGHSEEQETRVEKTKAFFDLMYKTLYMPSTPTLFNSGTIRPQLSSCYLTTIPDDLLGIYEGITDDALLSKFAGGIGNDWTQVRGLGSHIAGTNGKSQGVIPFMKVVNDTAVAVNQCFHPTTNVATEKGDIAINTIQQGDMVLTHDGSYKPVLKKLSHKYDGNLLDITVNGAIISVTPDHPVLVVKTTELLTPDQLKQMVLERKLKLEWIDAATIAPGYYVVGVKQ